MDENKTYSVVGTVTIGTDEYRDLIERVTSTTAENEKYRSESWAKERKITELTESYKAVKAMYDEANSFITRTNESTEAFGLWKIAKERQAKANRRDDDV